MGLLVGEGDCGMSERVDIEEFKRQLKGRTKAFAVSALLKESDELTRLFSSINRSAKLSPESRSNALPQRLLIPQ